MHRSSAAAAALELELRPAPRAVEVPKGVAIADNFMGELLRIPVRIRGGIRVFALSRAQRRRPLGRYRKLSIHCQLAGLIGPKTGNLTQNGVQDPT